MKNFSPHHHKSGSRPKREKIFNIPPVILWLFLLCCAVYIIPNYFMSSAAEEIFYSNFGFVPVVFLHNHDVLTQISAVSYSFLHGSLTHLGLNMLWFIIFGTPLANRLGSFFFILFWIFTAFAAVMIYCLLHFYSDIALVGASGAISGMMGASARYNFQTIGGSYMPESILSVKESMASRAVLVTLGSFVALNALTALSQGTMGFVGDSTNIAWEAHIGGLIAGFLSVGFFDEAAHHFKR